MCWQTNRMALADILQGLLNPVVKVKVKYSHYRPMGPGGFWEVKASRFRDIGTLRWWVVSLTHRPLVYVMFISNLRVSRRGISLVRNVTRMTTPVNLLPTKRNLLYIMNQSVPRCKPFALRL
jgi:hypothetical protein